jgi:hypothetical protein
MYVGSSTSLRNRRASHKSKCTNEKDKAYNRPVYQYIRENGGWDNWELLTIERVEYEFGFELKDRERHHMETLHATLNSQVPNRTAAEYHNDNKVEIHQRQKQYRQNHKVETKQYYQQYHQDNREELNQQKKQYYHQCKEKLNRKHDCPCGGKYTHQGIARHLKTERHQNYELGKQMYEAKFGHA